MSEVQNNLGEKFKETIAEAMKTGDFHALNTLVTDTVNDALREADFQANLSREATEKRCGIPNAAGRIKSGRKSRPRRRSRRNGSSGKSSRKSTADRTRNGTGSAESGKDSGKNSGRRRQQRTVHGIRHSR